MQKDFIIVTPDSGNRNATVTVTTSKNNKYESREVDITIEGASMKRTINITQQGQETIVIVGGTLEEYLKPQTKVNMIYTNSPEISTPSIGKYETRVGQTFTLACVIRCDKKYKNVLEQIGLLQGKTGYQSNVISYKEATPGASANFSGQWSRPLGIPSRFQVVTTRQVSLEEIHVQMKITGVQAEDESLYGFGIYFKDPISQQQVICFALFTLIVNR